MRGRGRSWDGNRSKGDLIFRYKRIREPEKQKRDAYFDRVSHEEEYKRALPYIGRYMSEEVSGRVKRYIYQIRQWLYRCARYSARYIWDSRHDSKR